MRGGFAQRSERAPRRPDTSRRTTATPRRLSETSSVRNGQTAQDVAGRTAGRRTGGAVGNLEEPREAKKARGAGVYRRRRVMAAALLVFGAVALVFAVFVGTQAPDAAKSALPIDPSNAAPDTVLAETAGVEVSTPIRPAELSGLGYHPEDESLSEMAPRGENLSANPFFGLFARGETPERLHYHVMDAAGREGPKTGAVDVGARAGTTVYAPVTGVITAIRPDPTVTDANIVEIKPATNPDVRIAVSLVQSGEGAGVNTPVTAGMTKLGTVANSAEILDPQLSSYTGDAGNHVTVSVSHSS